MPSGTRLLIVDDDPSLADLMANQLSELREAFSIREIGRASCRERV